MHIQVAPRIRAHTPTRPVERKPVRAARPQPQSAPCPVEQIAVEAAAALRAMYAIGEYDPVDRPAGLYKPALVKKLRKREQGPMLEDVRRLLLDRLYACVKAATYQRATSAKGALFQVMLIADDASYIEGQMINAKALRREDFQELESLQRRVALRGHSALKALEHLCADDDLRLLRTWFFKSEEDPMAVAEWTMAEAARPPNCALTGCAHGGVSGPHPALGRWT